MENDFVSRPGEVLSMKVLSFQTKADGEIFVFFVHDTISHYLLTTIGVKELNPATIMRKFNELMSEKEFLKVVSPPFTLVVDFAKDLLEELNLIVEPHQGRVIYDPDFIKENMVPDLNVLLEMMARGGGDDGR
jgi:hypothetical protein